MQIRIDDLTGPEVEQLLQEHLEDMASHSPLESVHALDLCALKAPHITFWTAWIEGDLAGCGALSELNASHAEIKSMRTSRTHLRQGVAAGLLRHILTVAKDRKYSRVSLETGTMRAFRPARILYQRFGFTDCAPYEGYQEDPHSICMTKIL